MDESHFKALKALSNNSELSQRDLSEEIGLSLGRINYIINSLIKSGHIKAKRFRNSRRKLAYMYILTPKGVRHKIEQTRNFLHKKTIEYNRLFTEIEELQKEVQQIDSEGT